MKVHTLKIPNIELNPRTGNFIATALKKTLGGFGYGNQLSSSKLKELDFYIKLPIQNEKISFSFMEHFIAELEAERLAELEAERLAELEAYLLATGLKDTRLTTQEQQALADFESIPFQSFKLFNLFGKSTRGTRLKSDDRIKGTLPFVTAGEADAGVSAFVGNDVTVFQKNTTTVDMFGSAKYRNYAYGGDDHIAVVNTEKLPQHAAIFVTAAIHKSSYTGEYHYGRNFYAKDADELNIQLPTKNNLPNYKYMDQLIRAIQKLVIKEVVAYADEKITATSQVITSRIKDDE